MRRQITTAANRRFSETQIRTPSKIDTGGRLLLFKSRKKRSIGRFYSRESLTTL